MFIYGMLAAQTFGEPILPVRRPPAEDFMLHGTEPSGAVIGILGGRPIHEAVVDRSGSRYEFRGAVPRLATGDVDVLALADAEWIVDGCMVYAACNRAARTR